MHRPTILSAGALLILFGAAPQLKAQLACEEKVTSNIRIDPGHPWRPPFGLDRVGKTLTAVVELGSATRPEREYYLAGFRDGHELERHVLNLSQGKDSFHATISLGSHPDQLVL